MCEFSGRLIAWMDGAAEPREAAEIARHIAACAECRKCVAEFKKISEQFDEYCDALVGENERIAARRWAPALCGVAAVAAGLVALVLAVPRAKVVQPEAPRATLEASAASGNTAIPGPASTMDRIAMPAAARDGRRSNARQAMLRQAKSRDRANQDAASPRDCSGRGCAFRGLRRVAADQAATDREISDAAIQIAIPAEAMFPPGAMPEGVNFVADLSIGADGSVEQLRLRPRLVRFERGAN